ncbi:hypothetical protein, partial [Butyricicoccus pullicaecorum]|uniref:hypothetical protein n=1 Tax=Butyricicoccus pullicaecorum TaxID=501571 RepID=UPI0039904A59
YSRNKYGNQGTICKGFVRGGGIGGEKTVSKVETVLVSGQWPRGMTRRARRVFIFVLVDFPL